MQIHELILIIKKSRTHIYFDLEQSSLISTSNLIHAKRAGQTCHICSPLESSLSPMKIPIFTFTNPTTCSHTHMNAHKWAQKKKKKTHRYSTKKSRWWRWRPIALFFKTEGWRKKCLHFTPSIIYFLHQFLN